MNLGHVWEIVEFPTEEACMNAQDIYSKSAEWPKEDKFIYVCVQK